MLNLKGLLDLKQSSRFGSSLLSKKLRGLEAKYSPTLSVPYFEMTVEMPTLWEVPACLPCRKKRDGSKMLCKKMYRVNSYYKKEY